MFEVINMGERFVIANDGMGGVSILDTEDEFNDGTNLLVFGLDFEDNEIVASYVAEELTVIVDLLNKQDKELKKLGITIPNFFILSNTFDNRSYHRNGNTYHSTYTGSNHIYR